MNRRPGRRIDRSICSIHYLDKDGKHRRGDYTTYEGQQKALDLADSRGWTVLAYA